MPIFKRRVSAPQRQTDYGKYRPLVREDFSECCAYCLLHELLSGGVDNYELDHFRPKSKPSAGMDLHNFYNLYYSCHACNHYKSDSWPDDALAQLGYRFVNTCEEDFSTHFRAEQDGRWAPLTPAGEYTEARLRLNRTHLIEMRKLLNEIVC